MTSKASTTKNLRLQRGDGVSGASASYTTIAECSNVKGPDEKVSLLDCTNFDSSAKEYKTGLSDGQPVTFDANFIGSDTQQQGLRTDLRAGSIRDFKFIANDSVGDPTYVIFSALVIMVPGLSGGVDAILKGAWELKPTGTITWHYSAGP